jgi:hypothetical protein
MHTHGKQGIYQAKQEPIHPPPCINYTVVSFMEDYLIEMDKGIEKRIFHTKEKWKFSDFLQNESFLPNGIKNSDFWCL